MATTDPKERNRNSQRRRRAARRTTTNEREDGVETENEKEHGRSNDCQDVSRRSQEEGKHEHDGGVGDVRPCQEDEKTCKVMEGKEENGAKKFETADTKWHTDDADQKRNRNEKNQNSRKKNSDNKNGENKNSNTKNNDKNARKQTTGQQDNRNRDESDSARAEIQPNKPNQKQQPPKKKKDIFPSHENLKLLLEMYAKKDPTIIRGTLRALASSSKKDALAFVACDRGSLKRDVVIKDNVHRNRALDGDEVFVRLVCTVENDQEEGSGKALSSVAKIEIEEQQLGETSKQTKLNNDNKSSGDHDDIPTEALRKIAVTPGQKKLHAEGSGSDEFDRSNEIRDDASSSGFYRGPMWADDEMQRSIWNPLVDVPLPPPLDIDMEKEDVAAVEDQWQGKVVFVLPPKAGSMANRRRPSELKPADESYRTAPPTRSIVGTLATLPGQSRMYVLVPNSKSLPRFVCPSNTEDLVKRSLEKTRAKGDEKVGDQLFKAEYAYGSWHSHHKYPPCRNLQRIGSIFSAEAETISLLEEFGVNHGDFSPDVLKNVDDAIDSGRYVGVETSTNMETIGWKPTPGMYRGRRDYRKQRIFTIDPTTAKDLDDAVHVRELGDGRVEVGVHIADVSHFVRPDTAVDQEAEYRATTVYLVDRTVPMLPRPLCEVVCSLNENVERLAFSCVWTMNKDGTLANKDSPKGHEEKDVWFGRTVIKSCARLDYATAQNIIDHKVATGEKVEDVDEGLWPRSRQPQGKPHTIDHVAADVRLLHQVAQARRKLRFESGALRLDGIKLTFQLPDCIDEEPPLLTEPYPIRDSNRLIEEYMLLANFLVSQHLILFARDRALLRRHPSPHQLGIQNLVHIAKESVGFDIDTSSSQALQESLNRLGRECDDKMVMQCITELAMIPMKPAEYFAAGELDRMDWRHFGLNIPFYTHFTSPIRRYADVIVHRLLQATIDADDETVSAFVQSSTEINDVAQHCNEKRLAADRAQERSDRVFLSLFLRASPLDSTLGVVLSVGEKTFMVFCPDLGLSTKVFVDEHSDRFEVESCKKEKRIVMKPKQGGGATLQIRVFAKLEVSCQCRGRPPLDVKIMVVGPWKEGYDGVVGFIHT